MKIVSRTVLVLSLVLFLTGCVLFTIAAPDAGPSAPNCSELVPGTPLPFNNDAAGLPINIEDWGDTIAIEIIGHSENRGYDIYLQQMLDDSPIAGKTYIVTNRWIGGHETWRWVTPGERGYRAVEDMLSEIQYPTIALVLTSNNMTYPIQQSDASDVNFVRFVTETEQLADHLYDDGNGARMIFYSSHRYKPANVWPAYNEMFGISAMLESAEVQGKGYIQVGPEQHDLHRCCYPDCYAPDQSHTNVEGDQLMALAWYNFLVTALTGEEIPAVPDTYTFVAVHFEAGYKGRIVNDLPIELPPKYLEMEFGWQEYLFETAQDLVQKANDYGFHLTLEFNPQWAEYILLDSARTSTVRQWQEQGHEIAFHHHSLHHPDWNGYSNDPSASSTLLYLGDVDAGLELVRDLAAPASITTAMIDGLPIDMPRSYNDTTENLIFTGGNQYDSFEQYGELRSLGPVKVVKANGGTVIRVAHRQLTWMNTEIPIEEALEIFMAEYGNMQHDEIYGIAFHCFDYLVAPSAYNEWFEFIRNSGNSVKSVSEVISEYAYGIPVQQ